MARSHTTAPHTHTWSVHCALSPNNKLGETAPVQHLISDCGFQLLDIAHYPSTSWSWTESLHIRRLLHHFWLNHAVAKKIVNSVSWRTHLAVHIIFCFYIKCWYHKNWLFNSLTTVWILPWSVLSLLLEASTGNLSRGFIDTFSVGSRPWTNSRLFYSCKRHHALSGRAVYPPPLPPVPSFMLAQNLSSKRIAPTDNMRPKSDNTKMHHRLSKAIACFLKSYTEIF